MDKKLMLFYMKYMDENVPTKKSNGAIDVELWLVSKIVPSISLLDSTIDEIESQDNFNRWVPDIEEQQKRLIKIDKINKK